MALLATLAAALAAPASAATFRIVAGAGISGCSAPGIDATNAQPFSRQIAARCDAGWEGSGSATAGFGSVGVQARAATRFNGQLMVVETQAEFQDTVIFTSTDPNAVSTSARMNLDLHGLFSNSGFTGGTIEGGGVFVNRSFGFGFGQGGSQLTFNGLELVNGPLHAAAGQTDAVLRTDMASIPLNVPVPISFVLRARSFSLNADNFSFVDFANTFEIPLGSDAFELPTGITANSGTWLVNNRRVDPNAGAVPEPATWALMIGGFGMAGAMLRRRKALAA